MTDIIDKTLPFFTYGVFRPGEISYLGIKDFVSSVCPLQIPGDLVLRDGITLYKKSNEHFVDGFLIYFKAEKSQNAYDYINSLEPRKLFEWKSEVLEENKRFNILYGLKPNRGSDDIREVNWKSIWDDPFFTSAIEVLEETPLESFEWNLKPLFKLQMRYMLLWTILERFSFLRYSIGGGPFERNNLLSLNEYYVEALKIFVKENRTVFSSADPDNKTTLNINNPKKSLEYYYLVRCNITHRGKAVTRDYDTVKRSFEELLNITKYVLQKTKEECITIKSTYEI